MSGLFYICCVSSQVRARFETPDRHSTFAIGSLLAVVTAKTGTLVLIHMFCSLNSLAKNGFAGLLMVSTAYVGPWA